MGRPGGFNPLSLSYITQTGPPPAGFQGSWSHIVLEFATRGRHYRVRSIGTNPGQEAVASVSARSE